MIYLPDGEIMQGARRGDGLRAPPLAGPADVVRLELSAAPHVSRGWYHQSAAIEWGAAADGARSGTARRGGWAHRNA